MRAAPKGYSSRCVMSLGRVVFTGRSVAPDGARPAPRIIRRSLSKLVEVLGFNGDAYVYVSRRKVREAPWREMGLAKPPTLEVRFYPWGFTSFWVRTEVHRRVGLEDLADLWGSVAVKMRGLIRSEGTRIGAKNGSKLFSLVNVVRGYVSERGWDRAVVFKLTAPLVRKEVSRSHAETRLTELKLRSPGDVFALSEFGVFAYFPSLTGRSGHRARKKLRRSVEYAADLALAQRLIGDNPNILAERKVADNLIFLAPGAITARREGICLDGFFSFIYKSISGKLNSAEAFLRAISHIRLIFPPRILDLGRLYLGMANLGLDSPVASDVAFAALGREEFDVVLLLAIKEIVDEEVAEPSLKAKALCEAARQFGLSQPPRISERSLAKRLESREDIKGSLSIPEICLVLTRIDESVLYASGGGLMNGLVAKGYVRRCEVGRAGKGVPKVEVYILTWLPQLSDLKSVIREPVRSIAWRVLRRD